MSRTFNDTTNLNGIVQAYEEEIGANQGDISGNTTKLKQFVSATKSAFDRYWSIALTASGKWQLDDSNQTDYPIITTNLVANQRDYAFTTDGSSNLILDIYKAAVLGSATGTLYSEIDPVDAQSEKYSPFVEDNTSTTGVPSTYDKTSNGIFLNPIPSYSATNGLKVYINREASYFATSDTTKKPGVPGNHHDYFYLYPAMIYARRFLSNDQYLKIKAAIDVMEKGIVDDFSRREKDVVPMFTPEPIIYE